MAGELCNFQTNYGGAPKDCGSLQQWLNTFTNLAPTLDQTRCSSGASDPTSADLNALWSPCTPPEGAIVVWHNTTTNEYQIWYYCGGSWGEAGTDICPAMDLRVVPNGTPTTSFNTYWTADGCSGPPDTGALVIENGTGNMWYWDSGTSSWNAISSGGGGGLIRYYGYANAYITGVTTYQFNVQWRDNSDTVVATTTSFNYTVQRTGWVEIRMEVTRHVVGTGSQGGIGIWVDGSLIRSEDTPDFDDTIAISGFTYQTAGTTIAVELTDTKWPQDQRWTTMWAYILEH